MNIEFFKPKETNSACKVTVHKTGKLGFSKSASDILDLKNNKYCKIGKDSNSEGADILFMLVSTEKDEFSYKISKAGEYYYLKAKQLLLDLEIDYKNDETTTIYDIEKSKINDIAFFKLMRRIIYKRKAK